MSVFLNGVPVSHWKEDNRGNLPAKFLIQDIKDLYGLILGGYNTLTLIGQTVDNLAFFGEEDIRNKCYTEMQVANTLIVIILKITNNLKKGEML